MFHRGIYRSTKNRKHFRLSNQRTSTTNIYPDLKIINAVTGIQTESLNEQKRINKLQEKGINKEDILDPKNDPYFKLLEGLRLMNEYFKVSVYNIITTPSSIATLEEIKKGFYIEDKIELRIDGEVHYYSTETRISVSLLEMIRIMAFGGPVSLVDKADTKRLYDELTKTITLADPDNKLSYNRLPYDPIVIEKMIELKDHLETNESWIFYIPETPEVNFNSKSLGSLYDILHGLDVYTEKNKQQNTEIDLSHIHRYKKRT